MNYWCEHCKNGLIDYCDSCFACDVGTKETPPSQFRPRINADKIRFMTVEELADFIARQRYSVIDPLADKFSIDVKPEFIKCREVILKWLKEEAQCTSE